MKGMKGTRAGLWILLVSAIAAVLTGLVVGLPPASLDDGYRRTLDMLEDPDALLWVDARSPTQFAEGSLPGAVPLYPGAWDDGFGQLLEHWDGTQAIIVFCDGASCEASQQVAARLREDLAFEEVYWLEDGWNALSEAGKLP